MSSPQNNVCVEGSVEVTPTSTTIVASELSPEMQEFGELIQFMETSLQETKKWLVRTKNLRKAHLQLTRRSTRKSRRGEMRAVPSVVGESSAHRANSGFNKPVCVSAELALLLGLSVHEPIPRVEVTKRLTQYFRDHNLQNPSNRREILMHGPKGEALRPLFPDLDPAKEPLSFFNLQRHLKRHFVSPPSVVVAATSAATVVGEEAPVVVAPPSAAPAVKVVKRVVVKK